MSIQEFDNMPAADNEIVIGDVMVARARSLIGKLQWMITLTRPDLSKRLHAALSLLNTRPTCEMIRAVKNVVRPHKKRRCKTKTSLNNGPSKDYLKERFGNLRNDSLAIKDNTKT